MKKPVLLLAVAAACFACGGGSNQGTVVEPSNPEIVFPSSNNLKEVLGDTSLPEKVRDVAMESEVWIEGSFPKGTIQDIMLGRATLAGFAVGDHLVLTCYHALAVGNEGRGPFFLKEPLLEVGWNDQVFSTEIASRDASHDLLLLKVVDPKGIFRKRPVIFQETSADFGIDRRLPWFAFGVIEKNFIVPREFHRFLGYFRDARSIRIEGDAMVLDEGIQAGFSGAPVLDRDGKCRGIISGGWPITTVAVGANQIQAFIDTYRAPLPKLVPKLLMPSPR